MVTREEYLARSLSKMQPWLAEGISRRQWERRRRKITANVQAPAIGLAVATTVSAKGTRSRLRPDLAANVESPARKARRAAVPPTVDMIPAPARNKDLRRQDEDLLMRRVHGYLDAQGLTHGDTQALAKAIHGIKLPERLEGMDKWALVKVYRRARARVPAGYDRWIALIEKWDKSYDRQKARNLVDRLVTAVGDRPRGILDRLFDYLERQICDHLPKKVRRLEFECPRMERNNYYMPQIREPKSDEFADEVYAALADEPKTREQLGQMFGRSLAAISSVGLRLRSEGRIKTFWDGDRFMWGRADAAPPFIAARDGIVVALRKRPMTVPELARETGKAQSTVKSVFYRYLLTKQVIRTKFGTYALAGTQPLYVSKRDAVIAALETGPMTIRTLAQVTCTPLTSLYQFIDPLVANGTVIRTNRGIYALARMAPVFVTTSDLIFRSLSKQPLRLGQLLEHINKSQNVGRSRGTVTNVLGRLKREGTVKQDRRGGELRLARRARVPR